MSIIVDFELHGGPTQHAPYLAWSPNNNYLAVQLTATSVGIIERETWQPIKLFDFAENRFSDMDWSPDGQFLAIGIVGNLQIWDVDSGEQITTIETPETGVNSVWWSPDGNYIAFTTPVPNTAAYVYVRQLHLWDVKKEVEINVMEITDLDYQPSLIRWSPDGSLLAIGSEKNLSVLDINGIDTTADIIPLTTLEGHRDWITNLFWSEDGKRLASISNWDGTVRVWGMEE